MSSKKRKFASSKSKKGKCLKGNANSIKWLQDTRTANRLRTKDSSSEKGNGHRPVNRIGESEHERRLQDQSYSEVEVKGSCGAEDHNRIQG
jgi:hypothetical protein